jgi:hypothetical protein
VQDEEMAEEKRMGMALQISVSRSPDVGREKQVADLDLTPEEAMQAELEPGSSARALATVA